MVEFVSNVQSNNNAAHAMLLESEESFHEFQFIKIKDENLKFGRVEYYFSTYGKSIIYILYKIWLSDFSIFMEVWSKKGKNIQANISTQRCPWKMLFEIFWLSP